MHTLSKSFKSKTLSHLPKPKGTFLLGNLSDFSKNTLQFLTHCSREYSDIIPLQLAFTPVCLLTNPSYIEQVLNNRELFIKGRFMRLIKIFMGNGLAFSEGDMWLRQRQMTQPVFHHLRVAAYGEMMVDYTQQMLNTWQDGETRDIYFDIMRLASNILMKTIFNLDIADEIAHDIPHALDITMDWVEIQRRQNYLIPYWVPTPQNLRHKNAIKQMDKTIYSIINQRQLNNSQDLGDVLSLFIQARNQDNGYQMTDKELRDQIVTLMFAGHQNITNILSWTWVLLSQHPQVETKLLAELSEVLDGRVPTIADLPRLHYTNMIVKEVLRLYPSGYMMFRQSTQDCEIGGYHIPAGYNIFLSQWVMHRHPDYFEAPDDFQPERWANNLESKLPKGVYFPFGLGPRACISGSFALTQAALLVATIAQKFQLTLAPGYEAVPQVTASLRPKNGVKVVLKKR
ncbi:cytochrome P450 [Nostoc sp. C117]|uniref:cytochrome P450 n=1 Tax=Nostoc sp. C117 TaxID=3349875 RepID=UPI00370D476F